MKETIRLCPNGCRNPSCRGECLPIRKELSGPRNPDDYDDGGPDGYGERDTVDRGPDGSYDPDIPYRPEYDPDAPDNPGIPYSGI